MLRNSETLGVGFVWVTLIFFLHSFLVIFFCWFCHCMCRFLLLFENFRIFKLQITEKFRLVQLVCASSGSLMHSSLPSFFSSSPHSCIRLIDFLISLLIFLAMSFEFSPKNTHAHKTLSCILSLFLSFCRIIFYHLQIIDESEKNKKNLQPPCRRKICEKFVKIFEKRENLLPYKNETHKQTRARSLVKNNRFSLM